MVYFCNMNARLNIVILIMFLSLGSLKCFAQQQPQSAAQKSVYLTPMCVYEGDTIPYVKLPTVYIFKPLKFKNKRDMNKYYKLIRDVKKVLPISKEINRAIIETYEYMMTLPTEKARQKHMKAVEKSLKEQYTPRMKKLTFAQGKLLIKLVDRQTNSTGYELVKAFMGPFKAGFYQTFAALFGASLKKQYDPMGDDALTERVILMVESGQLYTDVYSRLACLRMLKLAFHIICLSVFDELRTGLLEPEVHFIFHTNSAKVHHPFKITRAGFVTGFSPCNYLFNPFANSIST